MTVSAKAPQGRGLINLFRECLLSESQTAGRGLINLFGQVVWLEASWTCRGHWDARYSIRWATLFTAPTVRPPFQRSWPTTFTALTLGSFLWCCVFGEVVWVTCARFVRALVRDMCAICARHVRAFVRDMCAHLCATCARMCARLVRTFVCDSLVCVRVQSRQFRTEAVYG